MRASALRHAPREALRRAALVTALLLATPFLAGPATADVVENNMVAHNGNDAVGLGEPLTVAYHVRPSVNDKQTGCNAADGTPATLAVLPSSPSVRATPASLTFTACDAPQSVVLVGDVAGNYRINLAVWDANALGAYDVNGAEFTLHVLAPRDEAPPADVDGPALDATPPAGPVEATSAAGAVVAYSFTASDASGVADASCSPASGSVFPLGVTTVVCSATDLLGNPSVLSFDVAVVDTTPPTLALPAGVTLEATGPGGAAASWTASASDLVDGDVAVACDAASGGTFPLGASTVACWAADAAGNRADGAFAIAVVDTTPPTLLRPADVWAGATSGAGAAVPFDARSHDLVDGEARAACSAEPGALFGLGNTTVTCTATDAAGNAAPPVSFTVGVHFLCEGPLAPLKADGRTNVKLGSTVPIKCRPYGASAGAGDATLRLSLRQVNAAAPPGDLVALSTSAADSGNVMRWDAEAQQYVYNLSTKGLSKGAWQVTMDLGGGDARTFLLGLR